MQAIYERIGAVLPKKVREWIAEQTEYSGIDVDSQRFAGFIFIAGFGMALAVAVNLYVFLKFPFLPSFVISFVLAVGGSLYWMNNVVESKGKFVERILPDALQLIASNIKAGLTTERALFVSARPEFGPLSEELIKTSKKILGGERMEKALLEIPTKIKSKVLERTMWLISQGIKSGGQIADLLIELSNDLREENSLKAEIKANISMYIMLIFVTAAIGAPMLFGVSSYIVGVLSEQTANIGLTEEEISEFTAQSPALRIIGIPETGVSEEFVVFFSQVALFFTCLSAALTLGVIGTGNEKAGIKYLPILLVMGFALFFIARYVMEEFFGNMMLLF